MMNCTPDSEHASSMPFTYRDIFQQRAQEYHLAMSLSPNARDKEFETAVNTLHSFRKINSDDVVIDINAGGGYLKSYLPLGCNYCAFDESENFIELAKYAHNINSQLINDCLLPQESNSVDIVFSIAGLHHNYNLSQLFTEIYRCMKPGAWGVIADVDDNTGQSVFLNTSVHQFSSLGHVGEFFDSNTSQLFNNVGLVVKQDTTQNYHWHFNNREAMLEFCKLLFGMDRADSTQILHALNQHIGFTELADSTIDMNWALRHIVIYKPFI